MVCIDARLYTDSRASGSTIRSSNRPWLVVLALGAVTIVAYGVAYYSYGVLIDPIHHSTGWGSAPLGAIFSAILVIGGLGGLLGGRLVDQLGTRVPFAVAAVCGSAPLLAASYVHGLPAFAALYAGGCGVMSALGFYHVTQAAAIRADEHQPQRAVVWLTVLGAFASPIFLPLTAWLIDQLGWRDTLRIEAGLCAAVFLLAALVASPPGRPRAPLRAARSRPCSRRPGHCPRFAAGCWHRWSAAPRST